MVKIFLDSFKSDIHSVTLNIWTWVTCFLKIVDMWFAAKIKKRDIIKNKSIGSTLLFIVYLHQN